MFRSKMAQSWKDPVDRHFEYEDGSDSPFRVLELFVVEGKSRHNLSPKDPLSRSFHPSTLKIFEKICPGGEDSAHYFLKATTNADL